MEDLGFKIKILRQHWIKDDGKVDHNDLCSHGELYIKIGNEVLSNADSSSWCLTAAGLFLLRTLNKDYTAGDFDNYLIPCCGHFMIPDDKIDYVIIQGCNIGIDWDIRHVNEFVEFTTEAGLITKILKSNYEDVVIDFVHQVEQFYGDINLKHVPNEEFYQKGYQQFWTEWNDLKKLVNF